MPRLWQIIEQLATSQMSSQMPVRIACRTIHERVNVGRSGRSTCWNVTSQHESNEERWLPTFRVRHFVPHSPIIPVGARARNRYRLSHILSNRESGSCTAELGQFPNCKRMFPNQEVVKLTEHAHSRDQHTWIQCLHKLQMHLLLQLKSTAGPTPAHSTASRTH